MKQAQEILSIPTRRRGHHNITGQASGWVAKQGIGTGVLTIMIQHVRAALTIRDNVDRDDLHAFFNTLEGTDSPVGEAAPLYATTFTVPVRDGRMALGPRQGLFLYEDREGPQNRSVVLHLVGE
jgi:secondary thiamine-phosphate synthase enzyme